jgi:SPX domain protein involved in polyphosphate accumulation
MKTLETISINRFEDRYRHELKYYIGIVSFGDYQVLSGAFTRAMLIDPHSDEQKQYWIRSLYFDTPENDDYYEKVSGLFRRKKIRLRIYDMDQPDAKIEIKNRVRNFVFKESATLPREDAMELINGNKEVLLKSNDPTLNNVYYYMSKDLYRPVVLVDYEREAYVLPSEDIRITFDKNIRGSGVDFDLFSHAVHMTPAFDEETIVMEVKFKEFLPDWIRSILNIYMGEPHPISKYCFSRIIHFR